MEDILVSLEIAVLAKDKGYDQNPYKTKNAYGPEYTDGSNIKLRSSSLFNPDSNTAIAPSQSTLQKWFRDKHNIHIWIEVAMSIYADDDIPKLGYRYHVKKYSSGLLETQCTDSSFSKEYEIELNKALREALNLINYEKTN